MFLDQILNVDNRKLLLHKRKIINYLKGKKNNLISMEVDLSLSCNHSCPNCTYSSNHNNVFLVDSVMDKIIRSIPEIGAKGMIISGGGEPALHKGLGAFVKAVAALGVDVTLTTNGQLIHKHLEELMNNLKRIRFSIDAASHETFKYTHGKKKRDFEQVIDNVKKSVEFKKKNKIPIDIGVSFLICDENVQEMPFTIEYYKNLGVDFLHFKPMQFWDNKSNRYYYKRYPIVKKVYSTMESHHDNNFRVSISREKYFKGDALVQNYSICHGACFDMIIGADGKLYTCCHFKYDKKNCYGNLHKADFNEIFDKIKIDVTENCFPGCKMDAINQLVEYAKNNQNEFEKAEHEFDLYDLKFEANWL